MRDADGFQPIEIVEGRRDAGVIFLCDHASNALPPRYGDLGLPAAEFQRHIAYDIGAAAMTRAMAQAFGAPAVMTTYSRLLIDPNRGGDDPTLVMRLSDGAIVPGNARADAAEIEHRRATYWQPYRDAVSAMIEEMMATGVNPLVVSNHSFTPFWKATPRPWHVGILWDNDPRLPKPFIAALEAEGDLVVGDNEPYDGALPGDTLDEEVTAHGLAGALIEIRQDLIADAAGQAEWAARLARALRPILARPEVHVRAFAPSRSGRHKETGEIAADALTRPLASAHR